MGTLLTELKITRFKRFGAVHIELANPVVLIGPNNSGKTSALQALALWFVGLRKWTERREAGKATKRTGVSINRRELISIPLLRSHALWRDLRVRKANTPLRIVIEVRGTQDGIEWTCGMEFETVDQDNIRCRPVMRDNETTVSIPESARQVRIAFLPPMSGLVSQEDLLQAGSIERRIGEGRTADVLRNLCYRVYSERPSQWTQLKQQIAELFGVQLHDPQYNSETGTLALEYQEPRGTIFDLNSSGQGFRQTLLLLAYLYSNENTVLLLDEPDAHLELLRQRQIYQVLIQATRVLNNQLIIATHSEVILNDAAQRDLVIAFVGEPHRITKAAQVRRALADYGFEHYAQAEQRGWVLYLEGSTDLSILQALAQKLGHPAQDALRAPFVHYVANQPPKAHEHFWALREAFPSLVGVAIFDRLEKGLPEEQGVKLIMWSRRELENYIVTPAVLQQYAVSGVVNDLLGFPERNRRAALMQQLLEQRIPPIALNNLQHNWWLNTKITDDFLDELFTEYYRQLPTTNIFSKSDYHQLAEFLAPQDIAAEITAALAAIQSAHEIGKSHVETDAQFDDEEQSVDESDA